jgi:hypothetical protein
MQGDGGLYVFLGSARKLAQEFGLEELRYYINRRQCEIYKRRGWEFS